MIGSQQWNVNEDIACALFFLLGTGHKMVDNNNAMVMIKMCWDDGDGGCGDGGHADCANDNLHWQ